MSDVMEGMVVLFLVFSAAFLFSLAYSIVAYVLQGIGLYKMAKNTGVSYAWCAWVPVGHQFLVGHLADRYNRTRGKNSKFAPLLLIFYLISVFGGGFVGLVTGLLAGFAGDSMDAGFLSLITLLVILLSYGFAIAVTVIYYVASYRMYQDYEPANAVIYTVLAVFGLDFIAKFLCRNNVPVGVAGRVYPRQPKYDAAPQPSAPFAGAREWTQPPQYHPAPGQQIPPFTQDPRMQYNGPALQPSAPAPDLSPADPEPMEETQEPPCEE